MYDAAEWIYGMSIEVRVWGFEYRFRLNSLRQWGLSEFQWLLNKNNVKPDVW